MHKILISFYMVLFFSLNLYSQENNNSTSVLIYTKEPGFLSPFIESTLKELTNKSSDNNLYFNKVNSFNRIIEDSNISAQMARIIWNQDNASDLINIIPNENQKKYSNEIINTLTDYKYFLTVKTNTLGELIEFQFQLFQTNLTTDNEIKNNIPEQIIHKFIRVENFFINPKDPDYLLKIKNALHRLFINSNEKPIASLKIFGELIKSNDTINIPINTNIIIDGSNSLDYDTENILYIWKNLPKENETFQTFNKLKFKENLSEQIINTNKYNLHKVSFKVFDGVSYSDEIAFFLNPILKTEKVEILNPEFYSYHYKSLLNLNPDIKQSSRLYFLNNGISKNVVLTKNKLTDKYYKEDHIKNPILKFSIDSLNYNEVESIKINSEFPAPKFKRNNKIYFYSTGKDSILSKEQEINHVLKVRSVFTFFTEFSVEAIGSNKGRVSNNYDQIDILNDTINSGGTAFNLSIGLGISIIKNLELGINIPIMKSETLYYKSYEIYAPAPFKTWINYVFYSKKNHFRVGSLQPFIGSEFQSFKFSNREIENDSQRSSAFGGKIGVIYSLRSLKSFDLNLRLNTSWGLFTNNELSGVNYFNMGMSSTFRF